MDTDNGQLMVTYIVEIERIFLFPKPVSYQGTRACTCIEGTPYMSKVAFCSTPPLHGGTTVCTPVLFQDKEDCSVCTPPLPIIFIQDIRGCSACTPSHPFHPGQGGLFCVHSLFIQDNGNCSLPPIQTLWRSRRGGVPPFMCHCPSHPSIPVDRRDCTLFNSVPPVRIGGTVQCALPSGPFQDKSPSQWTGGTIHSPLSLSILVDRRDYTLSSVTLHPSGQDGLYTLLCHSPS
jgi:hypothetical protein